MVVEQYFKKFRVQFDNFLHSFEKQIISQIELSKSKNAFESFDQGYKKLSQIEQFLSLLKNELYENKKFEQLSNEFQNFFENMCKDKTIEEQLEKQINELELENVQNYQILDEIKNFEKSLNLLFKEHKTLSGLILDQQNNQEKFDQLQSQHNILLEKCAKKKEKISDLKQSNLDLKQSILELTKRPLNIRSCLNNNRESDDNNNNTNDNCIISQFKDCLPKSLKRFQFEDHIHPLKFSFQRKSYNWVCDKCDIKIKDYSWHCSTCGYDICLDCSQEISPFSNFSECILEQKHSFTDHNHPLNYTNNSKRSRIHCDKCRRVGVKNSWYCRECNFDLCLNCSFSKNVIQSS